MSGLHTVVSHPSSSIHSRVLCILLPWAYPAKPHEFFASWDLPYSTWKDDYLLGAVENIYLDVSIKNLAGNSKYYQGKILVKSWDAREE